MKMKDLIRILLAGFIATTLLGIRHAQAQTYNLMPQPAELTPGSGRLVIDGSFRVALEGYEEPRLEAAAARLIRRLANETAIPVSDVLKRIPAKRRW